jgi:hypothetical protein
MSICANTTYAFYKTHMLKSRLEHAYLTFTSTLASWIPTNMVGQAKYSLHHRFTEDPSATFRKFHKAFPFFKLGKYIGAFA